MENSTKMAYVRSWETAKRYEGNGSSYAVLVSAEDTDRKFSVIEIKAGEGSAMPWHMHKEQDETFYILDGKVQFDIADQSYTTEKGCFIFIPKGVAHKFLITSASATILNSFYPAGFEETLIEALAEVGSFERLAEFNIISEEEAKKPVSGKIQPLIGHRENYPALWGLAILWVLLADAEKTGGSNSFIDELIPQGPSASPHIHERAEEIFYVLDGEMTFFAGENWAPVKAKAGTLVVVPAGTKHSFQVDSPTVHLVNIYTPAGFEYIIERTTTAATAMTLPPDGLPAKDTEEIGAVFLATGKEFPAALTKLIPAEEVHNEKINKLFSRNT